MKTCEPDIFCCCRLVKYCQFPSGRVLPFTRGYLGPLVAVCTYFYFVLSDTSVDASVTSIVTKCIQHGLFLQFKSDPEVRHRNSDIPVRMPPCASIVIYCIGCRSFISCSRICACCCGGCLSVIVISAAVSRIRASGRHLHAQIDHKGISLAVVLGLNDQDLLSFVNRKFCHSRIL